MASLRRASRFTAWRERSRWRLRIRRLPGLRRSSGLAPLDLPAHDERRRSGNAERLGKTLSEGALSALAKVAAILPTELRRELEESSRLVGTPLKQLAPKVSSDLLRAAVRAERKLEIIYLDGKCQWNRTPWQPLIEPVSTDPLARAESRRQRVCESWFARRAARGIRGNSPDRFGQSH